MTDRLKGITVVFEHDIRDDDAERILEAIRCLRGVLKVEPTLSTPADWHIETRIKHDLRMKLFEVVK